MNLYVHTLGLQELINQYNAGLLNIDDFVEQQLQLEETRPRLEKVLSELQNIVNRGKQSLRTWNQSYEILQSEEREVIDLAFRYFTFVGSILLESAILQASKLTETSSDSINLNYFFNLLLSEGRKHFPQDWDEIKKSVKKDQRIAQNFQPPYR